MNIGFDLDRIFIDYPPAIPPILIDWLYKQSLRPDGLKQSLREILSLKNHSQKKISYRVPGQFEQLVRKFTHLTFFRPEIKENVDFVKQFSKTNPNNLYLISSRYKFLEDLTINRLKKCQLFTIFHSVNLNTSDQQPHFFKEKVINKLKIDLYIDDDLELLRYLKNRCPKVQLFWYQPNPQTNEDLGGIIRIDSLDEIKNYIK